MYFYSALTVVDERRQIGNLLSKFVLKINFGRDFEQQLDFYVEARGAFFNSDMVHYTLVHVSTGRAIATKRCDCNLTNVFVYSELIN